MVDAHERLSDTNVLILLFKFSIKKNVWMNRRSTRKKRVSKIFFASFSTPILYSLSFLIF